MVVPHEGTWIEIYPPFSWPLSLPSFPTRERGLKWQCSGECHRDPGSFPTRERGLKLNIINFCMSVYSRSPRGNVD